MTVLAVFRSRSQTIDFLSRLQRYGVTVQAVNTPKEAKIGCGLSAKFNFNALAQAKFILRNTKYSSFVGLYTWENRMGRQVFTSI
ncbi:MAG: DUF3343 domain-containing protein [Clostridia bacterium]|nr:DUF3343 domain-containing protein [Clostridia bacterium]